METNNQNRQPDTQRNTRPFGIFLAAAFYFVNAFLFLALLIISYGQATSQTGIFAPFFWIWITLIFSPITGLHLWLASAINTGGRGAHMTSIILGILSIPITGYIVLLIQNSRPDSFTPLSALALFIRTFAPFYLLLYVVIALYMYFSKSVKEYFKIS